MSLQFIYQNKRPVAFNLCTKFCPTPSNSSIRTRWRTWRCQYGLSCRFPEYGQKRINTPTSLITCLMSSQATQRQRETSFGESWSPWPPSTVKNSSRTAANSVLQQLLRELISQGSSILLLIGLKHYCLSPFCQVSRFSNFLWSFNIKFVC